MKKSKIFCAMPFISTMLNTYKTTSQIDYADLFEKYSQELISNHNLEIASLDVNGSKFFKRVYQNTLRVVRRKKVR